MRNILLIIPVLAVAAVVGVMTFPTGTAEADNGPHIEGWGATPDGCATCHRVHRGINEYLLVDEVENLCFSCHGNDALGSILNVVAGTNESDDSGLRAGGFETARIDTDDPSWRVRAVGTAESGVQCWNGLDDDADGVADDGCPVGIGVLPAVSAEAVQSKHSTDGSLQTIWGNGPISAVADAGLADYALTCGECHDPHGNGNYRILREVPSGSGGSGHAIPDTYPKADANYSTSDYFDMTFTGDVATDDILVDTSAWCAQCHTRYLASRRHPDPALASREDSGDAIFTFRHTSSGVSYSSSTGLPEKKTRACITCHASHGSNSTAGTYSGAVPLPDGFAGAGASDNRLLKMDNRGICQKCHGQ